MRYVRLLAGVDKDILDCVTTDEAYEIIGDTKTIDILMRINT